MVTTDVKTEFDRLVKEWYGKVSHHSNPNIWFDHPNYQKILDLGPEIIPLILEELKKDRGLWFDALYQLAGVDPVPEEVHKTREVKKYWMDWGRAHGYTN